MTRCTAMENPERTFFGPQTPAVALSLRVLTPEEQLRIREERKRKVSEWEKLDLRQTWADEDHMRGFLASHKVRMGSVVEPATPARLRTMVARAGLSGDDWTAAVGCSLTRFLELNPGLPLWAATALVLESAS